MLGGVYNVGSVGLDICTLFGDTSGVVGRYASALVKDVPDLSAKICLGRDMSGIGLARLASSKGSYLYTTDMSMIRPTDKNSLRRSTLEGMYKRSGRGMTFEARLESDARVKITSPSVSHAVIDTYDQIVKYLRTRKDLYFSRYIYALERPLLLESFAQDAGSSTIQAPGADVVELLSTMIALAKTLKESGVIIDVVWDARKREYFDNAMAERWGSGSEGSSVEMSIEAYKKVQKLAALFAVCRDMYDPKVSIKDIDEALSYLDEEKRILSSVEESNDMRLERKRDLLRRAHENLRGDYEGGASRNSKPRLHALGMLPVSHLLYLCGGLRSFAQDAKLTKKEGILQAVRDLVADGMLEILPDEHPLSKSGEDGKGRIFSDIVYVRGYAVERIKEWRDAKE